MGIANTKISYGWLAKSFHHVILLLLCFMLITGLFKHHVGSLFHYHVPCGIVVGVLMVLRLVWRLYSKPPALLMPSKMMNVAAHAMHMVLYLLVFMMPVSGLLMRMYEGKTLRAFGHVIPSFVAFNYQVGHMWHYVHKYTAWILLAAIVAHLLAALVHRNILKDHIWGRMMSFK